MFFKETLFSIGTAVIAGAPLVVEIANWNLRKPTGHKYSSRLYVDGQVFEYSPRRVGGVPQQLTRPPVGRIHRG